MNKVTKIIAAVLVLAGVVLAILALSLGGRRGPHAPPQTSQPLAAQYPVVVAARTLDAGQPVTADALKIVKLPNQPAGSFANATDVIGQIPQATITADTPVTRGALAHGIAMQLAAGERAIAIPVNEVSGVGNRVQPGDYVDLFVSLKAGQDNGDTQSRLLAPRLRVLSYGSQSLDDARVATGKTDRLNRPASAMSAVLAVPLDEVNPVALAAQNGKLLLALRPPTDETQPDPSLFPQPPAALAARSGLSAAQRDALDTPENRAYAGIVLAGLTGEAKMASRRAAAVHAPRGGHGGAGRSIEVIRGAQRESVAF